jgi:hypothetical protein
MIQLNPIDYGSFWAYCWIHNFFRHYVSGHTVAATVNPQRLDNVGVLVGDTWRIVPWPLWLSKEEGKLDLKNWDFTKNLIAQMGVSWGETLEI